MFGEREKTNTKPDKNYGIYSEDVPLLFYLAINKQIRDKMQNIFYLIAEHFSFMKYKYTLNKFY